MIVPYLLKRAFADWRAHEFTLYGNNLNLHALTVTRAIGHRLQILLEAKGIHFKLSVVAGAYFYKLKTNSKTAWGKTYSKSVISSSKLPLSTVYSKYSRVQSQD